ncbi:MAG: choice-of-anchor tandem repeat NxxGxxAF-containing protein, partial [Planctomycetota bacterium]
MPVIEVLYSEGDAAPGGGELGFPDLPTHANGNIVVAPLVTNSPGSTNDGRTLLRFDADGGRTQLFRTGTPTPDGIGVFGVSFSDAADTPGVFNRLVHIPVNAAGDVAVLSDIFDSNIAQDAGVFKVASDGTIRQIARRGDAAPDGIGEFGSFSNISLGETGNVAFNVGIAGTPGLPTSKRALYLDDGVSTVELARVGRNVAGGPGVYEFMFRPSMDTAGRAAFSAVLRVEDDAGTRFDRGIYLGDGAGVVPVARTGQAAPGGGTFASFNEQIDSSGDGMIAFSAGISGAPDGSNAGVYRRNSDGSLTEFVREGQTVPDGKGTYQFFRDPAMNSVGQVAFEVQLDDVTNPSPSNRMIVRGETDGSVRQIARSGQAAPFGDGTFEFLFDPAINAKGQLAFQANVAQTPGQNGVSQIFFFDDTLGLLPVAKSGDLIDGRPINFPLLSFTYGVMDDTRSGLDDQGRIAFTAFYSGGES